MAHYPYRCTGCNQEFEIEMKPSEVGKKPIACPKCKKTDVSRVYTVFALKTSRKS
ncbi:MAG: zinc ribbon domain-containing protein [Deltaproteobacteria bacterium]|nr:zinc ribbon domain-containing protein [Deltaproteobacteria bacterium]